MNERETPVDHRAEAVADALEEWLAVIERARHDDGDQYVTPWSEITDARATFIAALQGLVAQVTP